MVAVPQGFRRVTANAAPPDLSGAVEWQESRGNPNAVSPKGARGRMQIMPATAADPGFGISPMQDIDDPDENKRFGSEYLSAMLQRYSGDEDAALVAYNAGPTFADRWVKGGKNPQALYPETRDYLGKVKGYRTAAMGQTSTQEPEGPGAQPPQEPTAPTTGGVKVPLGFRRVQDASPAAEGQAPSLVRKPDGSMRFSETGGVTVAPKGQQPYNLSSAPEMEANALPSVDDALGFMTGYTRSLVGQGMGAGFGDEGEAGVRAALIKAQGDERSFMDIYNEQLEKIRGEQKQFGEEHPIIAGGTELAGAVASMGLPVGRIAQATRGPVTAAQYAARAPSWGRAALQEGAKGAAYGGAYGFGTGEGEQERLERAKTGAAFGGALGGAAGAALPVAGAVVKAAGAPITARVRGLINPEGEAARQAALAFEKDQALAQRLGPGPSRGLTQQQEAIARQQTGQPIVNLDLGGETTRALARSAANQSPEARAVINKTIDDRFEGQGERVISWLRSRTGFSGDVAATREAADTAARTANRPNYAAAYKAGNWNVSSPELTRLSQAGEVQQALALARKRGNSVAIADKMPWRPSDRTTLQLWDYAQRELRSLADKASAAGDKGRARVLSGLRRDLNKELDNLVPEFNTARTGAAKFFQAEDALEAGQKFVNLNVDMGAAKLALAKMSPAERQLFAEGYASSVMDKVSRTPDRADVVRRIWSNAKVREQMDVALGPAAAKEFEAFMGIESVMDAARGSMGNSTTARQLVELGLAGTAGTASGLYTGDPSTGLLIAALTWGGRRGARAADHGVAKSIAELLTSNDPSKYRRGIQAVTKSRQHLESLRSFIASAAGVSAAQSGSQQSDGTE